MISQWWLQGCWMDSMSLKERLNRWGVKFMSKKILMKLKLVGLVVGDDNVVGYGMIVLQ
jgi:hypoxanthine-guanine phosphoribosyltransferase